MAARGRWASRVDRLIPDSVVCESNHELNRARLTCVAGLFGAFAMLGFTVPSHLLMGQPGIAVPGMGPDPLSPLLDIASNYRTSR